MLYRDCMRYLILTLFVFLMPFASDAQDPKNGQALFLEKCASCYNNNMVNDLTGPALHKVEERWENQADLYRWIRESQAMIAEEHPRAKELWSDWGPTIMNNFPELTDPMIDDILAYIENKGNCGQADCTNVAAAPGGGTGETVNEPKESSNTLLYILAGVLLFTVVLLARYINSLNRLAQQTAGQQQDDEKSILEILLSKGVIRVLTFVGVILIGYTTVNNAIGLSRQQGYAPTQPIKFSHETHAGINEIDCQYCHDGARRSKHSVIPATNTCMNCHTAIQKGPSYGTAEIMKIYASAGYDPIAGTYFDETISDSARLETYKVWATKQADANELKDNRTKVEEDINLQLKAAKDFIAKPIEWVRIHNLPDHVYFNHAQHVVAGKVECQTCHGQVQEMEVVQQHSPLSMGWCINCHRETDVKMKGNEYYAKIHEELSKKYGVDKLTAAQMGGLECGKCHY